MNGFLLSFYTAQNRTYQGQMMSEWLLAVAKQMNLPGATVLAGMEGIDHQGLLHSASFFELADRPVQIQFALSNQQATELLNYLDDQEIALFYVKTPIEFGVVGQAKTDS